MSLNYQSYGLEFITKLYCIETQIETLSWKRKCCSEVRVIQLVCAQRYTLQLLSFQKSLGGFSQEQEERFLRITMVMEESYQDSLDRHVMVDDHCSFQQDCLADLHKTKLHRQDFSIMH